MRRKLRWNSFRNPVWFGKLKGTLFRTEGKDRKRRGERTAWTVTRRGETERRGNTPGSNSSLFKWGRVRLSSFKCTRCTRGPTVHVSHALRDTLLHFPSGVETPVDSSIRNSHCNCNDFSFGNFFFFFKVSQFEKYHLGLLD